MAVQRIYSAGTVSVTAGSATVVGSGTAFELALINGGSLSVKGRSIPIVDVPDDTHLTLAYAAPADMAGNAQPYAVDLGRADAADAIVSNRLLAEIADALGAKVSPFARTLLDDVDAATVRATIGASTKASELFAYLQAQRYKYGPSADISWEGLEAAALQLESDATTPGAAGLLLHRLGSFACYFGLDKLNRLAVGGRTFGAVSHAIWHDGIIEKSLAETGYRKLPDGMIEQWGRVTGANVAVTFPRAFPTRCVHASAETEGGNTADGVLYAASVSGVSASGMTVRSRYQQGATTGLASEVVRWSAKGY